MDKLSSVLGEGFSDLVNSENKKIRFVWLIFVIFSIGCIGGIFYLIVKSIIDYKNFDVITNLKSNYVSELDFPGVTLCPFAFKNPDNLQIVDYQFDENDIFDILSADKKPNVEINQF